RDTHPRCEEARVIGDDREVEVHPAAYGDLRLCVERRRHSRESGNPFGPSRKWIPACAGMTTENLRRHFIASTTRVSSAFNFVSTSFSTARAHWRKPAWFLSTAMPTG